MLIVSNPKNVFLGTSSKLGEYGTKISQLAKDYDAMAGINAGGFSDENGTGKGGIPTGIIIEDGANLDGGSSSVMYFEGKIVNSPSSVYGDRYLPSAFLIKGDGLTSKNIINNLNN